MTPINMDTNAMKGRMERSTVSMGAAGLEEGGHHPPMPMPMRASRLSLCSLSFLLLSYCGASCSPLVSAG